MKVNQNIITIIAIFFITFYACGQKKTNKEITMENKSNLELATFGAGCFWCVEAIFQDLKGVHKVESGYAGGSVKNPSYKEVCNGTTGHAEVAQIEFDPSVISFDEILEVFWKTHDPTTLNQQGADKGTQYRSAIFVNDDSERETANKLIAILEAKGYDIATVVLPAAKFWPAELYHQDYYDNKGGTPYCHAFTKRF